jgi:hypothetical protein
MHFWNWENAYMAMGKDSCILQDGYSYEETLHSVMQMSSGT